MRLHAALALPEATTRHLAAALVAVQDAPEQVAWLEPRQWSINLAAFGNVTLGDAMRLEHVLTEEVARTEPFDLRLASVTPLPEDGDDSVWVGVDGAVESLRSLAIAIPNSVKQHGFALDRRGFRARVRLGRVTPQTSLAYLERLVALLDGYRGPTWTVDHLLLDRQLRGGSSQGAEFGEPHRITFQPAALPGA